MWVRRFAGMGACQLFKHEAAALERGLGQGGWSASSSKALALFERRLGKFLLIDRVAGIGLTKPLEDRRHLLIMLERLGGRLEDRGDLAQPRVRTPQLG